MERQQASFCVAATCPPQTQPELLIAVPRRVHCPPRWFVRAPTAVYLVLVLLLVPGAVARTLCARLTRGVPDRWRLLAAVGNASPVRLLGRARGNPKPCCTPTNVDPLLAVYLPLSPHARLGLPKTQKTKN